MDVIEEALRANEAYVARASLPKLPSKRLAVVACMDARMDVYRILGLEPGEAHVIRNAGGVVTDDVMRSLIISQRLLETTDVMLLHHTACGMLTFTDTDFRARLARETGYEPPFSFEPFADTDRDVRDGMKRIAESPFLVSHRVRGFVYDIATGRLREVS